MPSASRQSRNGRPRRSASMMSFSSTAERACGAAWTTDSPCVSLFSAPRPLSRLDLSGGRLRAVSPQIQESRAYLRLGCSRARPRPMRCDCRRPLTCSWTRGRGERTAMIVAHGWLHHPPWSPCQQRPPGGSSVRGENHRLRTQRRGGPPVTPVLQVPTTTSRVSRCCGVVGSQPLGSDSSCCAHGSSSGVCGRERGRSGAQDLWAPAARCSSAEYSVARSTPVPCSHGQWQAP